MQWCYGSPKDCCCWRLYRSQLLQQRAFENFSDKRSTRLQLRVMRAIPSTGAACLWRCRAKIAATNGEPRGWACLSTPPKGNKLSKKWVVRQERGEKVGTWEAEECMRKPQMCFGAHFPWTKARREESLTYSVCCVASQRAELGWRFLVITDTRKPHQTPRELRWRRQPMDASILLYIIWAKLRPLKGLLGMWCYYLSFFLVLRRSHTASWKASQSFFMSISFCVLPWSRILPRNHLNQLRLNVHHMWYVWSIR